MARDRGITQGNCHWMGRESESVILALRQEWGKRLLLYIISVLILQVKTNVMTVLLPLASLLVLGKRTL